MSLSRKIPMTTLTKQLLFKGHKRARKYVKSERDKQAEIDELMKIHDEQQQIIASMGAEIERLTLDLNTACCAAGAYEEEIRRKDAKPKTKNQ